MASEQEMTIGFEQVIAALPQLDAAELADVMDRASSLLKKAIGGGAPLKKGVTPHQLERNHAWTNYVLADSTMNGWTSFVMKTTKMNKETEEKEVTEVLLRESVETESGHVFADTGKPMSQGQAMCYGKLLRDHNDVVWQDFEAQYEAMAPKASVKASVKKVVKKTSQEVQEEKQKKELAAAQEKARKAAEKEEEKKEEKRKKEEEKKKKEEEKAKQKPVSKVVTIAPRPRSRSPVPAAVEVPAEVEAPVAVAVVEAPVAVAVVEAPVEEAMPALEPLPTVVEEAVKEGMPALEPYKVVKAVTKKKVMIPKKVVVEERPAVDPFVPRVGGGMKRWTWKETEYLRDEDNYIWVFDAVAKATGEFKGCYDYKTDVIVECDEPQFEEDEEEA